MSSYTYEMKCDDCGAVIGYAMLADKHAPADSYRCVGCAKITLTEEWTVRANGSTTRVRKLLDGSVLDRTYWGPDEAPLRFMRSNIASVTIEETMDRGEF